MNMAIDAARQNPFALCINDLVALEIVAERNDPAARYADIAGKAVGRSRDLPAANNRFVDAGVHRFSPMPFSAADINRPGIERWLLKQPAPLAEPASIESCQLQGFP